MPLGTHTKYVLALKKVVPEVMVTAALAFTIASEELQIHSVITFVPFIKGKTITYPLKLIYIPDINISWSIYMF